MISTRLLNRYFPPLAPLAISLALLAAPVLSPATFAQDAPNPKDNADTAAELEGGAPDKPVDSGAIKPTVEDLKPEASDQEIPTAPLPTDTKATPALPKGPDAESLPAGQRPKDIPDSQAPANNKPDSMRPVDETVTGQPATVTPNVEPATEIPKSEALDYLIKQGVLPSDAFTRSSITRAQLANMMVYAMGYDTELISEFPFYRDIPASHWAYKHIEVARERKLIDYPDDHGFYKPEDAVTNGEVYTAISKVLTASVPAEDVNRQTVSGFADGAQVSSELVTPVAKMTQARFFPSDVADRKKIALNAGASATPANIAPLMVRLIQLTGSHPTEGLAATDTNGFVAIIPAGTSMSIKPAGAIVRSQLAVGAPVNFVLTSEAGPLPKDSRLKGRVISAADGTFKLNIFTVSTPGWKDSYEINAPLEITFPDTSENAYIDPDHVFEIKNGEPMPIQDKAAAKSLGATPINDDSPGILTRAKNVVTSPVRLIKSGVGAIRNKIGGDDNQPSDEGDKK